MKATVSDVKKLAESVGYESVVVWSSHFFMGEIHSSSYKIRLSNDNLNGWLDLQSDLVCLDYNFDNFLKLASIQLSKFDFAVFAKRYQRKLQRLSK